MKIKIETVRIAVLLMLAGSIGIMLHWSIPASDGMRHFMEFLLITVGSFVGLWILLGHLRRYRSEAMSMSVAYMFLIGWGLVILIPTLWMSLMSFKSSGEIFSNPYGLPQALTGEREWTQIYQNYTAAWKESSFGQYFLNSIKVVSITVLVQLFLGSLAAYGLSRFKLKINKFLLIFFIANLAVPFQISIFPLFFQYIEMSDLLTRLVSPVLGFLGYENPAVSLTDTHTGLVLIYLATGLSFTILVLSGFFKSLPKELYESAILDGCSEFQAFWKVMLPLARPGIIMIAIFSTIGLYNEYMTALIFITSDSLKTIPLGLAQVSLQAEFRGQYGMLFSSLVIASIPTLLFFIFLQRRITKGITIGAVKG
jgi:ABC-type glycerol-3-phosphate transport system permease component